MTKATKSNKGAATRALVPVRPKADVLSRHDIVESRLYPHIRTHEQAGVVLAKAINHNLCPTFVAENLIPIQGKMAGTGLYLAAVLGKTDKYRTVTVHNDHTKATIEFYELVPHAGKEGGPSWIKKGVESFGAEEAKRAQLTNQNYQKYPQHMYYWRALAGGARKHCADAIAGSFTHLIEELDQNVLVDEDGVPIGRARAKADDVVDAEVVSKPSPIELVEQARSLIAATNTDLAKVEGHLGCTLEEAGPTDLAEVIKQLETKKAMPAKGKK